MVTRWRSLGYKFTVSPRCAHYRSLRICAPKWASGNIPMVSSIRELTVLELATVSELAVRSKGHWGYSQDFLDACKEELAATPAEFNDPNFHFRAMELNDKIVGYYAIVCVSPTLYELDALFVEPVFIGKGIGKQLMEHAKELVKKLGGSKITLQAEPNAEPFYLKSGGVAVGKKESQSIKGRYLSLIEIELLE